MASSPITSWQIDGETVETASDVILGGYKITADGDYSHEIKRCLLPEINISNIQKIKKKGKMHIQNGQAMISTPQGLCSLPMDRKSTHICFPFILTSFQ